MDLAPMIDNDAGIEDKPKLVKNSSSNVSPVSRKSPNSGSSIVIADSAGFHYPNPDQDLLIYMVMFKTERCGKKPCSRTCEKFHSLKERRRSPLQFSNYSETPCPNVKCAPVAAGKSTWGDPTRCPKGDSCEFSHTLLEQMYHPNIYKTGLCNKFNPDPAVNTCLWSALCTHAHGLEDRDKQSKALEKLKELQAKGITELVADSLSNSGYSTPIGIRAAPTAGDVQSRIEQEVDWFDDRASEGSDKLLKSLEIDVPNNAAVNLSTSPYSANPLNRILSAPLQDKGFSTVEKNPIGKRSASTATPKQTDANSPSSVSQLMGLGSLPLLQNSGIRPSLSNSNSPTGVLMLNKGLASSFGNMNSNGVWSMSSSNDSNTAWGNNPSSDLQKSGFTVLNAPASRQDDQLKKEIERLKSKVMCPHCTMQEKEVLLLPCRHFLCSTCADKAISKGSCVNCDVECTAFTQIKL
jgi:hypothetical protein